MKHLNDCYGDVFSYVLSLTAQAQSPVGYDKAREDILGLFQQAEAQAAAGRFDPQDVEDARFAVCAWVDESILRSGWEGARSWRTSQMQLLFYNTHNAGVEFFTRLEAVRGRTSLARETYALCLGLGFQGGYLADGREDELAEVRTKAILEAAGKNRLDFREGEEPMFPQAYQAKTKTRSKFNPWAFDWWFFLIPALTVVLVVELYMYYRNDLNLQLLAFFGSQG